MSDSVRYIKTDLPKLLKLLQLSDVRELQLEEGGVRIRVHRTPLAFDGEVRVGAPEIDTMSPFEPEMQEITAPMVGTFYRAAEPDTPPLADTGSVVDEHTVVGIIEALQVLNPVESGLAGIVTRVLATDGQPVGYGHPLFEVAPGG